MKAAVSSWWSRFAVAPPGPDDEIIALTTEVKSLRDTLANLNATNTKSATGSTPTGTKLKSEDLNPNWRITKVENGNEFNMVIVDGKKYWWCPTGHKWDGAERPLYVTHKPGAQHDRWVARKNKWLESRRSQREKENAGDDKANGTDNTAADTGDKKLALSQSLQAALMTKAGLSEDQFQQIWCEACSDSGN